jgi:hypothetical protein
MTARCISRLLGLLAATSLLAAAETATAQMTMLQSQRWTYAMAQYQGVVDSTRDVAPSPTAYFESTSDALAEKYEPCPEPPPDECFVGSCSSGAFQYSEAFPAGIQFSGGAGAGWGIPPSGTWEFDSWVYHRFRIDTVFDYQLYMQVDPGDFGGTGGEVELMSAAGFTYHYMNAGDILVNGRLGPGEYVLKGQSNGSGTADTWQGAVFAAQWTVMQVIAPIITTQPPDRLVLCGGTTTFPITTSGPAGSYTYQWRKNLTPLTNNGHFSGVTTGTLTITNACHADTGHYDVVVTTISGPTVIEPSRLAHLGITTSTGVGDEPVATVRGLSLAAPAPNPFRLTTSVRYALPTPTHLRAAVYDLAGARVRTLVDEVVPASGAVTWDGNTLSGSRAPRGIYFLHVEAGGMRQTKRIVLVD